MVILFPEEKEIVARVNATLKKLYEKAIALQKDSHNAKAMVYWDKALEIDSENAYALHHKGVLLEEATRNAEAIDCYDKALEIDPNNFLALKIKSLETHHGPPV